MGNHLRIALKHLLDRNNISSEIIDGNCKVQMEIAENIPIISITHLKYLSKDEYQIGKWNIQDKTKTFFIFEDNSCPP